MVMRINVLLVEDDHALREALADTLLLAGHGFRAVCSGEEALAAVMLEPFSLVISDVNMPGMDGHQLLAQLRANRWLEHLRLIDHAPAQRRKRQFGPGADGEQPEHQHQA